MAQVMYWGTGRRKKAVARVRLVPGDGKFLVNKRDFNEYFGGLETLKMIARAPLSLTETEGKYDVIVNVRGGGFTAGAAPSPLSARSLHHAQSPPQGFPCGGLSFSVYLA